MREFKLKTREEYIAAFKQAIERKREWERQTHEEFIEMRRRADEIRKRYEATES